MFEDIHQLRERARGAIARNALDEAANSLVLAAMQTHVPENDYQTVLRPLADVLVRRGDPRSSLTVQWYMARTDPSGWQRAVGLFPQVPHVDRARTYAAMGEMDNAAREMEAAGVIAAAAIFREKAGDFHGARALWSRLSQVANGANRSNAYISGLIEFNLGRCANKCKDTRQAREAIVSAVRMLEEAADHYESVGQRERAFDCFQVLVQIGRESQTFENVLEGYVNCIRILREDHLKYFALQYYEDALSAARKGKELSAAATIAREAAEYARSLGMHAASTHYTLLQAELWRDLARAHAERGAPPEISENAILAAVLAFGEVGQFARVGGLYRELSQLGIESARQAHYLRASSRYQSLTDEHVEAAPLASHLRQDSSFPDVWHVDVVEWEQHGSAAEACADVLLDPRWPDLIRRKAMIARLTSFAVEGRQEDAASASARIRLAEQLADLQLYAVLSPLERLFESKERGVRVAVLTAMQRLFFKRSFDTVRKGIKDSDPTVVAEAAKAVRSLYFQHAFDPLSRIVRESSDPKVRAAAIFALSRVDTVEAAEFLLGVLDHGAPVERGAAIESLKQARGVRFIELARSVLATSSPTTQASLRDVLRARGIQA
ncbi:MAG: HEAT repeat domain-containing protein [Polyangiaceae bacterium]